MTEITQISLAERPEYKNYAELAGVLISMSEASRLYQVPQQTISRWVKNGLVARLGQAGKKVMIDQAQIATAAEIYHAREGGQGRWVFKGSTIYTKKEKNL